MKIKPLKMPLWDKTPGKCEEIPQITYYGAALKRTDAAVVIFPGGGYGGRSSHEGEGYAGFLNADGIDAFVVDYRVSPHRFPLELLDARRAVRFVRHNAERFGIDREKIIAMGSSAGGHLAAMLCTYTKPVDFECADEIDAQEFLPNAQALCYPVICSPSGDKVAHVGSYENLLGSENMSFADNISPEKNVRPSTPAAFIWHTSEDAAVSVINSYRYASALKENGVAVEMHIFPFGRHGLGAAPDFPHVAQWTELMINWMAYMKFM